MECQGMGLYKVGNYLRGERGGRERGLLGDYTQRMYTWSAREGEYHEEMLEHLGTLGILSETAPLQLLTYM